MKHRLFFIIAVLAVLFAMLPTGAARADDGEYKFYGTIASLPNTTG